MIAIYKTPTDREFFDKHYLETHIPLAKTLPGLVRYDVAKGGILSTTGHEDVYCIGTLYFESLAAIKMAFASEEGKACAADRRILAPQTQDVQIYIFDSIEV
ncbi:EthD family reductase [Sphingobacterium sp. Ag1]|uniref:EthD family reductase n=1 Tax=Sphingobacterium sp. Ag1 TaxID=1643451 RepID=UPI001E444A3F|nr:EthD family reductase [Sphingobacterium sp. Ag1]